MARTYSGDSHGTHWQRWQQVVTARQKWTREAWIDSLVEAGKAWSQTELGVFLSQDRQALNYNLTRNAVETICGMEKQSRSQVRAMPRERSDISTARAYNEISAYVDSQNRTHSKVSKAARFAVVTGAGWLEVTKNPDATKEPVAILAPNTFDMFRDPAGREADLSDSLDVWRVRWMRPVDVEALFGRKPEVGSQDPFYDPLSHTSDWTNTHGDRPPIPLFNGGSYGTSSWGPGHGTGVQVLDGFALQTYERLYEVDRYQGLVCVVERWYRCPEWVVYAVLPDGTSLEYTQENVPAITAAMMRGPVAWERVWRDRIRCAVFTEDALYQDKPSPYEHGRFPFVLLPAYEDEEGLPMGYVRACRDPQREFNSRATNLLKRALQRQVLAEDGAFVDEAEAARELAKPDGWVRLQQGALARGALQIRDDAAMTDVEFQLMNIPRQMIQDWLGINQELAGQETNAKSGKAILARQSQGMTALYTLFDNRNETQIRVEELKLALVQQFYTEEREIRITGSQGKGWNFVRVNAKMPDGSIENPISTAKLDLELVNQQATETERQARAESMREYLATLPPEVNLEMAPAMVEAMDLPEEFTQKLGEVVERLLERIRGPMPPEEGELPPEGQAGAPVEQMGPAGAPIPPMAGT